MALTRRVSKSTTVSRSVMKTATLMLCMIVMGRLSAEAASAYYVSPTGSDTNSGTSASSPWQTISKVNATVLNPGDSALFEGGQTFAGNLVINSESGMPGAPITIASYGTGNATIQAATGNAVEINKSAYVTVTKLTVSGPGWNLGTLTDDSRGVNLDG